MITRQDIERLPPATFHKPDEVTRIKNEILSTTEEDDRDWLLYALGQRLIAENVLDEAERVARLMETYPIERTWFFGSIAAKLWKLGHTERALHLLGEAIPIASSSGVEWQRAESLTKLARHFIEINQKERAVKLLSKAAQIAQAGERQSNAVGNMQDAIDSASVLGEVAEAFTGIGEIRQAEKIARSIMNGFKRCCVLERINAA